MARLIEMATRRTGTDRKGDRGWNWACYCPVCIELRRLA